MGTQRSLLSTFVPVSRKSSAQTKPSVCCLWQPLSPEQCIKCSDHHCSVSMCPWRRSTPHVSCSRLRQYARVTRYCLRTKPGARLGPHSSPSQAQPPCLLQEPPPGKSWACSWHWGVTLGICALAEPWGQLPVVLLACTPGIAPSQQSPSWFWGRPTRTFVAWQPRSCFQAN